MLQAMQIRLSADKDKRPRTPFLPKAFLAKCSPDLQQQPGQRQQVQLSVTVDGQPGADSSPAGARGGEA